MSGFVSEENILLNQQATTKEEALRTISDAAARIGVADDADAVYAAFLAREEIDKTGMVDGFAVPHCKTDAVKSAAVIIFKNAQRRRHGAAHPRLRGRHHAPAPALEGRHAAHG